MHSTVKRAGKLGTLLGLVVGLIGAPLCPLVCSVTGDTPAPVATVAEHAPPCHAPAAPASSPPLEHPAGDHPCGDQCEGLDRSIPSHLLDAPTPGSGAFAVAPVPAPLTASPTRGAAVALTWLAGRRAPPDLLTLHSILLI